MILVNGIPSELIQTSDRGLMYGDGVFRTLRLHAGKPVWWPQHYSKLQADCTALGIEPPSLQTLEQDLALLAQSGPECVVKIIVTRGNGMRGYAPNPAAQPNRIVMASPNPSYPVHYHEQGVALHLCDLRLSEQPRLAGIKHLNRLENVLARMEWNDPSIAEGLLLDMAGNVIEGTMSNLFMLKEGSLHTPDLSRCGVAGVTRDRIMAMAPQLGLSHAVGDYDLDFLLAAEEVVLCNSVIGVWQVKTCCNRQWPSGPLATKLRAMLNDEGT